MWLKEAMELDTRKGRLVVRPVAVPRSGWEEAFRRMAGQADDALLDQRTLPLTQWDGTDWEW